MSINVLLDDKINKLFRDNPELEEVDKNKFEIAVAEFANLRHLNGIESEDLIAGILGEGGDEGIDHCYIFCNGMLVNDSNHPINKESNIKVKFFQTKKESGFSTDGFRKTKEGIEEIFNLEMDISKLRQIGANEDFRDKAELIRAIFREARLQNANFSCEVFYVTASKDKEISEKIEHLKKEMKRNSLEIPYEFYFWNAQDLLNLTSTVDEKIVIKFNSQPLEIKEVGVETNGYAGFVEGKVIVESLLEESGDFKDYLTEGNVRFFLGEDKQINNSIIESSQEKKKAEIFWAMNNGLTIIGEDIKALGNNQYSILNPQIVNGCQTIHCLYTSFKEKREFPSGLKVFVKLVIAENLDVQTDIISATNSQNPVKSASLKANDNIQRNIEQHLLKSDIFYERRENFYKRQGHTGNKVIGLLKMAQILQSVLNKESIVALNDTSSLFDTEAKYKLLFNESSDYDIYTFSVILYQKIWTMKNSDLRTNEYENAEKEFISKSGFPFLHIMSSLILSEAKFKSGETSISSPMINRIDISMPERKNEFSKRKKSAFEILDNDSELLSKYNLAKDILYSAAEKYSAATGKDKRNLFKARTFDKDYLVSAISESVNQATV